MADDLDALPTKELHDRALHRAEKHLDVRFLWSLLEMIPAAEAAAGDVDRADYDVTHARSQLRDLLHSGDGELAELLRPAFVEYLRAHPDA